MLYNLYLSILKHLEEHDLRSVLFLTRTNPGAPWETTVGTSTRMRCFGVYDESRWRHINTHHFRIRSQYFRLLQQSTLHWSCLVDCFIIWAATDMRLSEWSWAAKSKQSQEQEPLKWMPTAVSDVMYVRLFVLPRGSEALLLRWNLPCAIIYTRYSKSIL